MPQYQVQPGDNLYDIAQKTTGDGNRWREIYEQNKTTVGQDPGMIQPGQVLSIPYDQQAVNEGNSMNNGTTQSQGDYPAPSIQPYNSQRYPDPRQQQGALSPVSSSAPNTMGAASLAGSSYQPPSSSPGANSQPQAPLLAGMQPSMPQSLSPQKGGLSPYQASYDQARNQQGYATTGGYPQQPTQPQAQGPYPTAGTGPYTQQVSAANAYQQLSPREQMARQMAPDQRAQMGVSVLPPGRSPGSPVVNYPNPPQALQSASQMVQWPAPPRVTQGNPVGPQAYQGRFQTNTGAPRPINAYTGYMGRPFDGTNQQGPQAPQGPTSIPTNVPSFGGAQQQQPQAVIVIQADGTRIIYDPKTGQWHQG